MTRKLILSLLCTILLIGGVVLANLLTQPSLADINKPTPTLAVLLTPLPADQLIPSLPPPSSEVIDLAPDVPKSEKYTLFVNDLKGGLKEIRVPAKRLNEEINKIDPALLIAIAHPSPDLNEEVANHQKMEQSIVITQTVPTIPTVNPDADQKIPTPPATPPSPDYDSDAPVKTLS